MQDYKTIIADNIQNLRKKNGITQIELAEELNYTDKAISKWERGESIPDVTVLKAIADRFGVTVDYLLTAEHTEIAESDEKLTKRQWKNRAFITGISVVLVWLIATLAYFFADIGEIVILKQAYIMWLAVPVSLIVWLVLNSIWFNTHRNFLIISLLMWSLLATLFFTFLFFSNNFWILFLLGIPGQAIIVLWSGIRPHKKNK